MRINEFLIEDPQFIERLKVAHDLLRKELDMAADSEEGKFYSDYIIKMIRGFEEAIASGKNSSARRIVLGVLPDKTEYRDAAAKYRASPSTKMFAGALRSSKTLRQKARTEKLRRKAYLEAMKKGMELRRMLKLDANLNSV